MSEEEGDELNHNEFFLPRMLKRIPEHVFTEEDLQKEDTLNQAIDLFYYESQGQQEVTEVLRVYISYDTLSEDLKSGA